MDNLGIGERVRFARKQVGLGSRDLDRLAGLSLNHTANLERRPGGIDGVVAVRIARVLGSTVEWLVTGEGAPPSPSVTRATVDAPRARLSHAGAAA